VQELKEACTLMNIINTRNITTVNTASVPHDNDTNKDDITQEMHTSNKEKFLLISNAVSMTGLLLDYYLCFADYTRHKNDVEHHAEDLIVMSNDRDILVAIDGGELSGKRITDVMKVILAKQEGNVVAFLFVDQVAFNDHDYKRV
jgi:hypothetical protein